jgi:hypothetical protein
MPSVTLNGTEHSDVNSEFLDGITRRLSSAILRQRSNRIDMDYLLVVTELERLYGRGLKSKPWYKDYVMQFCRDRKIPCRRENL